jgi:hypothetical protein
MRVLKSVAALIESSAFGDFTAGATQRRSDKPAIA